jgi:hypothetical protein
MNKTFFHIGLLDQLAQQIPGEDECSALAFQGIIQIDDFQESFLSSSVFWKSQDYEAHWKEQIKIIVSGGTVSCLITSMIDPGSANFIFWWTLYRSDRIVYFQNQILFLSSIAGPFDVEHPERHVRERSVRTEDGEEISEWKTSVEALQAFLQRSAGAD